MNTQKSILAIALVSMMALPVMTKAQANRSATAAHLNEKPSWEPVKMTSDEKNTIDGVQFFSKVSDCNGSEVTLVKLINGNNKAAQISYQMTAESPVVVFNLAASSMVEGVCFTKDANLAKLNIAWPKDKTAEEISKIKGYLMKHIFVSIAQ